MSLLFAGALAPLALINLSQLGMVVVGILGFIVAFGLAVFIHELGHFLAAKAFGVPVERFVIGFDKEAMDFMPRCIVEFKYGETTYGLSLVPLGGYVKMVGTVHPEIEKYLEGDTKPTTERADGPARVESSKPATLPEQAMGDMAALYRKPFWQKVVIYGAGVVMNMLLAMVVVTVLYTRGFQESAPFPAEVLWIKSTSSFVDRGIAVGDRVEQVNGKPVKDADAMAEALAPILSSEAGPFKAELAMIRRDGSRYALPVDLTQEVREDFFITFVAMPPYIDGVVINGAADEAGIRSGDRVTSIDGQSIVAWHQLRDIIRQGAEKDLAVTVKRGEDVLSLKARPSESPEEPNVGQLGIMPGNTNRMLVQEPFGTALTKSPERVLNFTKQYVNNLKRLGSKLVGGNIAVVRQEIGGPVGIAQVAYRQAQKGFNDWLKFLVLLNVALAVMNSLPLPVLDGGHFCFALYEAIFRRPVSPKILVPLLNGAVIFLIVFFVLVTFNDVLKILL